MSRPRIAEVNRLPLAHLKELNMLQKYNFAAQKVNKTVIVEWLPDAPTILNDQCSEKELMK